MKKFIFAVTVLLVSLLWVSLAFADDGTMTLEGGVAWLLTGGGAGTATYILVDKVPFLKKQAPDYKRYWSIGIVLALTGVGWGLGMLMGYMPTPETWRGWIETAFSTGFVALTTSLLIHGRVDLRKKRLKGS